MHHPEVSQSCSLAPMWHHQLFCSWHGINISSLTPFPHVSQELRTAVKYGNHAKPGVSALLLSQCLYSHYCQPKLGDRAEQVQAEQWVQTGWWVQAGCQAAFVGRETPAQASPTPQLENISAVVGSTYPRSSQGRGQEGSVGYKGKWQCEQ